MRVRTVANNETCDLQVFENAELGKIRSVVKDGEPWFVGKDVAEILGYTNPSKALLDHVDVEDKLNNETLSGKRKVPQFWGT